VFLKELIHFIDDLIIPPSLDKTPLLFQFIIGLCLEIWYLLPNDSLYQAFMSNINPIGITETSGTKFS